jgi:hypothetical protein
MFWLRLVYRRRTQKRDVSEDSRSTINFKLLLAFVNVGGGAGGGEGGTSLFHKGDGHGIPRDNEPRLR